MIALPASLRHLLDEQGGLVARAQVLEGGHQVHDVRRWVRQRLLTPVHEGVYVGHTGPLTWHQRSVAAVLYAAPAALHGCCVLRAVHGPGWRGHDDHGPVHVAVDVSRRVARQPGVVVHRVAGMHERTLWHLCPPRMRVEEAVLDVASTAVDDFAAVQVVAAAVGARSTTAARLNEALSRRTRIARRVFLRALIEDVAQGACSVLEVAYLRDVERAHGLPRGRRQAPRPDRPGLRDVLYVEQETIVELDGRLDHTRLADRDADLDRDLQALTDGLVTARVGWGQAVRRTCRTARALGSLLRARGWAGEPTACTRCP
ncbi:hypothetical protein [Nocardioides aurantiacus]|uniref:hypothetical protein n=1 Tax=Nocardioides aurantiacus TaxID=86796 RepID=UPI001B85BD5B|nr:hypothetical protein [Nocardioides aurantiacus]